MSEQEEAGGGGERERVVLEYATGADAGREQAWGGLAAGSLVCAVVAALALVAFGVVGPSFVAGVLIWVAFGAAVAAVIMGSMAWARWRGRGIMCAIQAVGVFVGVFGLVMSAAAPFNCGGSPERAKRIICASRLKQIGVGLYIYATDHGGLLPMRFEQLIADPGADLNPELFVCPSTNDEKATGATTQAVVADFGKAHRCSYVYRAADRRLGDLPSGFIVAHEKVGNHKAAGMNVVFADGHVEWVDGAEAKRIVAELDGGHNPPRAKP